MSEHIVELYNDEREELLKWLARPNGSHRVGRVNFEAVEGGGILVRTHPYSYAEDQVRLAARAKRRRPPSSS